jgi:hypothetical protein
MFLFTYSSIAEMVLLALNCISIGPYHVIQSLPSINCDSDYYHSIEPIMIVWLIMAVILIPVLMTLFLLYHRHHIVSMLPANIGVGGSDRRVPIGALNEPLLVSINAPKSMKRWSVLYESFDNNHWYTMIWSIVLLGRRALLVALLQLSLGLFRSSMLALFSFISLIIHIIARPYKRPIANHLESIALGCHAILSICITSQQLPYLIGLKIVIFLLVSVPTIILFSTIIIIEYRACRANNKTVNEHDADDQYNNINDDLSISSASPINS